MKVCLVITLFLLLLLNPIPNGYAVKNENTPDPNCSYQEILVKPNNELPDFTNPESISSTKGELKTTLEVKYADNQIADCKVNLRSYNGKLVGPTLRVKPGDSINIKLINKLPPEEHEKKAIRTILPKLPELPDGCEYEEPIGGVKNEPHNFNTTNFHTHGLHVDPKDCSDNVLRIMKPRKETDSENFAPEYKIHIQIPKNHPSGTFWYHAHLHGSTALQVSSGMGGALIVEGGLDDIPEIKKAEEKIFVFGQIAYDEQGKIEDYKNFGFNSQANASEWEVSKRRTTINGQIVPKITMHPGEVQRWRFIHAGIQETINVKLRKKGTKKNIKLHEIAVDGIPLGKLDSWENIVLQPGYRSDVLVKAPSEETQPQEYELIDEPSQFDMGNDEQKSSIKVLAKVIVEGTVSEMNLPEDEQIAKVKKDVAPADINDDEVTGEEKQNVVFDMDSGQFMINKNSFNPKHRRILKLNNAQIWKLSSESGKHPFHIHVNPFQYDRMDPNGKPERIWRDTLMITKGHPETIRSRYERFSGQFVLHCHILEHEDKGMMEIVEIIN